MAAAAPIILQSAAPLLDKLLIAGVVIGGGFLIYEAYKCEQSGSKNLLSCMIGGAIGDVLDATPVGQLIDETKSQIQQGITNAKEIGQLVRSNIGRIPTT
jgi:lipoprotein signal peptidase